MSHKPIGMPQCGTALALALFGLAFAESTLGVAGERSQTMVIRLLTPLASYQPAGTLFDARVIGPELRDGAQLLPSDSVVTGKVEKSESVRLGIRRERALLQLEFDGCVLPDKTPVPCRVDLQEVDNARETVRDNRIEGALVASHAYSLLSGMVYTPFMLNPIGAVAVAGSRMLWERLPDPEIQFPAGTELLVRVQVPDGFAASHETVGRCLPRCQNGWQRSLRMST